MSNNKMNCKKCAYLQELYKGTKKTNREYWLMTELFVMLHSGDVCKGEKNEPNIRFKT